ncbi:hypothetical protein HDC90_004009 [Pedobacter sp. AK013]|nr:hypothetical protein [Pedobacter sp. AK013]
MTTALMDSADDSIVESYLFRFIMLKESYKTRASNENNLTTDKKDAHSYKNLCLSVCICG